MPGSGPPAVSELVAEYSETFSSPDTASATDVQRVLDLLTGSTNPWSRTTALHLTASALIVHRDSGRLLLRWHERLQMWAQVGGHADEGEQDPLAICLREGAEETGLRDLKPCELPDRLRAGALLDLVIVRDPGRKDAPARAGERAHEHADLRFFLETTSPESAVPESPGAPVRWLSFTDALAAVGTNNLSVTIERAQALLGD